MRNHDGVPFTVIDILNKVNFKRTKKEKENNIEKILFCDDFDNIFLNSLKNHDGVQFNMKDRLKKVNFKRTKQEKENHVDLVTIHSTKIEKVLFSDIWKGRHLYSDHYTVPNNSAYCK